MSWITLPAILVGWALVGLAVAYLFGRVVQRGEGPGETGKAVSAEVTYLHRAKRAKTSRATPHAETRRAAGAGRRH